MYFKLKSYFSRVIIMIIVMFVCVFPCKGLDINEYSEEDSDVIIITSVCDTKSNLEYTCFPHCITVWLGNDDVDSLECVNIDYLLNGTFNLEFLRNNWTGQINLQNTLSKLPSKLNLDFIHTSGEQKAVFLKNILASGTSDFINIFQSELYTLGRKYKFYLSYEDRIAYLHCDETGEKYNFTLSDGNYSLSQVIGLYVSIALEKAIQL